MVVTAKELAGDSEGLLNRVIDRGEKVQIQRHGRIVAQIVPAEGVSRDELIAALAQAHWTQEESREMKRAADGCSEIVGYAGGD
jgi:antitoxin (DNA-binding transcriptional repressor) of toxin-antitoxin stability system